MEGCHDVLLKSHPLSVGKSSLHINGKTEVYCERQHPGNEEHLSPSVSLDCYDMCQTSLLTARIWGQSCT